MTVPHMIHLMIAARRWPQPEAPAAIAAIKGTDHRLSSGWMLQTVADGEARRTAHLARLTAALISGGSLPLAVLKVVSSPAQPVCGSCPADS